MLLLLHLAALLVFALNLGFSTWTGIAFSAAFDADPHQSMWKLLLGIIVTVGFAWAMTALVSGLTHSTIWAAIVFASWLPAFLLGLALPG
ncbi:hypothetical protein [Streptomyces sp. E-08]|uniref:hypothetical protein n=1 Tax=Streptomyces sp. E-08 TaxID=3404047 RepID=UPI003CF4D6BA